MGLFNEGDNIEKLRKELIWLGKEKGLSSKETVCLSQKLDQALNGIYGIEDHTPNFPKLNEALNKETMILVTNMKGYIIYLNDKCSDALGYGPEELIGKHTRVFKTDVHTVKFYQELWETVTSGEVWSGEITSKRIDGTFGWYFMTIVPLLDEDQKPFQLLTIRFDITEQKEMEKQIYLKDKQLQSYSEILSKTIIGCIDSDGKILNISASAEKLLGYKFVVREELSVFNYIDPNTVPDIKQKIEELKKIPGGTMKMEIRLRSKSGEFLTFEFTAKNHLDDPKIKAIIFTSHDITKQKKFNQKIHNMLYFDSLTGLPNYRSFEEKLNIEIQHAKDHYKSLAVILLSLDDFRFINSTFGHQIGDLLLKEFSVRLKSILSDKAALHRMNGDIFVLLMKDILHPEKINQTLNKMAALINKEPFIIKGNEIYVSVSIGVSHYPYSGENQEILLKNAEIAMYRAKHNGKNQCQVFSPTMDLFSYKQFILRNDSKKALVRNEFCVYYQPRVDPVNGEMVSAEALIRWEHPKWGMVVPEEFIAMAEESGLIIPIGEWMIRKICSELKKWERENIWYKRISINLSSLQLIQANFVEKVTSILNETGVKPTWIEFEITESAVIKNEEQVIKTLQGLKSLGITIALDDFGTGYSSLSYLMKLPCDTIKIDKSLINEIHRDKDNHEIISSIIALCHKLRKSVVAEGVESKEQLMVLRKLNCDEVQGYLYSKPINEVEYKKVLKEGRKFRIDQEQTIHHVNRRKFSRVPLDFAMVADMTIEKIANKKINIGSSEVMVKNISPGGLCFYSQLKLPVRNDIILLFKTRINRTVLHLIGHVVWKEEMESNYYEYGIKFMLDRISQEQLNRQLKQYNRT